MNKVLAALPFLLAFGCTTRVILGVDDGGISTGTAATGSGTAGSTGSTTGAGTTGASSTSAGGSSTGGSSSGSGASSTGGFTIRDGGWCGPGTAWLGDICVAQDCSAPVSATTQVVCALPDGGLGLCSAGICIAPFDPENCGGRGIVCPVSSKCLGDVCSYGCVSAANCPSSQPACSPFSGSCALATCSPASDDLACTDDAGELGFCCQGVCASSDPGDCGGCGIHCPAGSACAGNVCAPIQTCGAAGSDPFGSCALSNGARGFCCGSECLDSNDPTNCGICGLGCGGQLSCVFGVCQTFPCTASFDCAPGEDCGVGVDGLMACFALSCADAGEDSACLVPDAGVMGICRTGNCASIDDPAHCGLTGVECQPGEFCFEGTYCRPLLDCNKGGGAYPYGLEAVCLTDAGALGSCCGDSCLDLTTDSNCGTCSGSCPTGTHCGTYAGDYLGCLSGGVQSGCTSDDQCPAGTLCAGFDCLPPTCDGKTQDYCSFDGGAGRCCGSACSPPGTECGGSCPAGAVRSTTGGCVEPDGGPVCAPGAVCPAGDVCVPRESACLSLDICSSLDAGSWESDCPFGGNYYFTGLCCGTVCTDPGQDPNNCFGCGVVCPSGICVASSTQYGVGRCLPAGPTADCNASCGPGSTCLDGKCIDGSCENSPFCVAVDSTIGECCLGASVGDSAARANGTCAHPLDDPHNCGLCGNDCGPGGACVNGSCSTFPGCGLGRLNAFCNLDAGPQFLCCPNVGCTDTQTDANNCLICGSQCLPGQACVGGACQY